MPSHVILDWISETPRWNGWNKWHGWICGPPSAWAYRSFHVLVHKIKSLGVVWLASQAMGDGVTEDNLLQQYSLYYRPGYMDRSARWSS